MRPKLEYCVQVWRPFLRKGIDRLERVQARATRLIVGCKNKNLSYSDRLKMAGLPTLEDRRDRKGLIEVFKILRGFQKLTRVLGLDCPSIIGQEGINIR